MKKFDAKVPRHDGDDPDSEGDTPVGYRNPPPKYRFKKGRSGNPRGRRKGSQNLLSVFKKVAREKVRVRLGGEVRIMTRAVSVIWANYYAQLNKNQNAMNNMFALAEEVGQFVDRDDTGQRGTPIAPSQPLTLEEFEALFGNPEPNGRAPKGSQTRH